MNTSTNAFCRNAAVLALPVTLAAFGTAAWAQSQSVTYSATYVCRQAAADETATAKMMGSSTSLVCRPIAVSMRMSDGSLKTIGNGAVTPMSGPDFSQALTPQQVNAAYNRWLRKELDIDPATRHSP